MPQCEEKPQRKPTLDESDDIWNLLGGMAEEGEGSPCTSEGSPCKSADSESTNAPDSPDAPESADRRSHRTGDVEEKADSDSEGLHNKCRREQSGSSTASERDEDEAAVDDKGTDQFSKVVSKALINGSKFWLPGARAAEEEEAAESQTVQTVTEEAGEEGEEDEEVSGDANGTSGKCTSVNCTSTLRANVNCTSTFDPSQISIRYLNGGLDGYVLDNVLTKDECRQLIQQSHNAGYRFWAEGEDGGQYDFGKGVADETVDSANNSPSDNGNDSSPNDSSPNNSPTDSSPKLNDTLSTTNPPPKNPPHLFRTAFTCETNVPHLGNLLFERMKPFMPLNKSFVDEDDENYELDLQGEWECSEVNPTWLFARYLNGGHFSPHTDGTTTFDFNSRTMYTILVYLNGVGEDTMGEVDSMRSSDNPDGSCHGAGNDSANAASKSARSESTGGCKLSELPPFSGATRMFDNKQIWEDLKVVQESDNTQDSEKEGSNENLKDYDTNSDSNNQGKKFTKKDITVNRMGGSEDLVLDAVLPKAGRVLVFYHRLMHEGLPSRCKYIIRTDYIFKRCEPLLTSERDREAYKLYQEAELLAEDGKARAAGEKFRIAFKMSEGLRKIFKQ
jgi:hypothetical protein